MGLFKILQGQSDCYYFPNPCAKYLHPEHHLEYFRFAGQVLAKAMFEKIPVNISL